MGTYASEAVSTTISDTEQHTLAIVAVTAKDWTTTDTSTGEPVTLVIDSITLGDIAGATLTNLQWRPFGNSVGSSINQTQ